MARTEADAFIDSYLRRLGAADSRAGGEADPGRPRLLRELQAAHLTRIPFENLSIHLGEPLSLEPDALADKILGRGRGGFCYELNGLFARLLEHLGYRVTLHGAQVWTGERFGPPLDHLALMVGTAGGGDRWLADVGFGDHAVYPLPWRESTDIPDPGGVFRLEKAADGDWDVYRDGVVQYRVDAHPRALADFDAMCWYQANSPRSHFTRSVVCSRRTSEGRVTLSGRQLITTTAAGRDEKELAGDRAVLDAYRTIFGISLDRVPAAPACP